MTLFKHQRATWEVHDTRLGGVPVPKPVPPKPPAPKPVAAPQAAAHVAAPKPAVVKDQADLKWEKNVHATEHGSAEPHVKAAVQVALRHMLGHHVPQDDAGRTHSRHVPVDAQGAPRERDFGHRPVDLGPVKPGGKEPGPSLYALNTATPGKPEVVWADNGRRLSGSQWAAMAPEQRVRVASHVEPAQREAFTQHMDTQAGAFADPKANPAVRPDVVDLLQDAGEVLGEAYASLKPQPAAENVHTVHRERLERDRAPLPEQEAAADLDKQVGLATATVNTLKGGLDWAAKLGPLSQEMNENVGARARELLDIGRAKLSGQPVPALSALPPEPPSPGTTASRLGALTGGLGTVLGLASLYNDYQQLKVDGDARHGLDAVSHIGDTAGGIEALAIGLSGSGLPMSGPLKTLVGVVSGPALEKGFQIVGGVGLMAGGAADMSRNAEAFNQNPTFGNTLGYEVGALKLAGGAAMTSGGPTGKLYGGALALTAGGLELIKAVYDNNDTVRAGIDTAGEFHQQWMGAAYCATMGIPKEVSAEPTRLPHAPAGGWADYMATHSEAEVAQYFADHGLRAPGT